MKGQSPEPIPAIPGQSPADVPTMSGQTLEGDRIVSGQSPDVVPKGSVETPESVPNESGDASKNQHLHLHLQKEIKSTSVLSSAAAAPAPPPPQITPAKVFHLWNDLGCKPSLTELTPERSKRLAVRIRKRGDPAWWEQLFLKAKAVHKPFITFDFLIANDTNAIKLLEGNYDHDFGSRNNGGRRQAGPGAHQNPNPANPGKFAARARILSTDPGGGGTSPETDSPGHGSVPGAPERPPG